MTPAPLLDFPVADGHFHLWRPGRLRYPWLAPDAPEPPSMSYAPLRRDFRVADYRRTVGARLDLRGGVHVEANCAEPEAETAWVKAEAADFALRHVARIDLSADDAARKVVAALADPVVCGFRMRLNADPRIHPAGVPADDAVFGPAFAAMEKAGTVFELSIFPAQAAEAERLAARWPGITFALNHLGWPRIEAGHDTYGDWRAMIETLAGRPNIVIKLSMLSPIDRAWRAERLRPYVREALEAFGPERMVWGSNHPIETLFGDPADQVSTLLDILHDLDRDALAEIFRGTACRVYGLKF